MKKGKEMFVKFIKRMARMCLKPILARKKMYMRDNANSVRSLVEVVDALWKNEDLVMVEIGSYRGESAEIFLSTGKVKRIYCIDPWKMFYDADDGAAFTNMEVVERDFDERFSHDARVVKEKGTIDDFFEKYKNCKDVLDNIDAVYIDGCHTYDAVKHDIETVCTHIRPRIAICGHDYCEGVWNGAKRAVDEMLGTPDRVFGDTSWMKLMVK